MRTFNEFRSRYARLYAAVKTEHEQSSHKHRGHGLDHDAAVAQMAALIAPAEKLADMGWVAGLIHSTDRLMKGIDPASKLREHLSLLPPEGFSPSEVEEIFVAALEHAEKIPTHRSPTQEILQDADKLVNMQAMVLIRVGQFRHDMPAVELQYLKGKNPASTYHAPKNVLDNVRIVAEEYPPLLFTEKGRELGLQYAEQLRTYERQVLADYTLLGLTDAFL